MLDYKFLEAWNKLTEANMGEVVGHVPYTKFTKDRGAGITDEQWMVLKAKYSSAGARLSIYVDERGELQKDLAAKEGSQWMYNLQLMVNAFAIENEVVNHINNNIADIEAKINTRLAKYRAAENAATKSAEGSETETISSVEQPPVASKFADIKLAKEYELAGTDEQHIDLLSQIPLEGGRGAVDLRAKPQAAGQINKIEVKATFKYFSGMPKATNFHGAEIVAVYSMLLKRLYFYYNIERKTNAKDLNKKSYVRVASINCAIPCVKILPEGIRVVDY